MATRNVYVATAALIQRCVGGKPSKGGQATDFGESPNLREALCGSKIGG